MGGKAEDKQSEGNKLEEDVELCLNPSFWRVEKVQVHQEECQTSPGVCPPAPKTTSIDCDSIQGNVTS